MARRVLAAMEWMMVSLAEMGMKQVWARMRESVIHMRCLVTVGFMSQETHLGLISIEMAFRVLGVDEIT